jgi:hypothetical protein
MTIAVHANCVRTLIVHRQEEDVASFRWSWQAGQREDRPGNKKREQCNQ